MASIPLFENIPWFKVIESFSYYFAIALFIGFFVGLFYFMYHVMSFKYRVTVYPLIGSGTTEGLAVGKPKKNRFKWNAKKTAWRSLWPLFNKKEIEPFEPKYIYSGNNIVAFEFGEHYLPGCINISKSESNDVLTQINPIPHSVRKWQALQMMQNAAEFAKHSFWEDNKYFIMTVLTAGLCLTMVGLTVYFTYEFAAGGQSVMGSLTNALNNFGGAPPPG